jgi:hypothetical protein
LFNCLRFYDAFTQSSLCMQSFSTLSNGDCFGNFLKCFYKCNVFWLSTKKKQGNLIMKVYKQSTIVLGMIFFPPIYDKGLCFPYIILFTYVNLKVYWARCFISHFVILKNCWKLVKFTLEKERNSKKIPIIFSLIFSKLLKWKIIDQWYVENKWLMMQWWKVISHGEDNIVLTFPFILFELNIWFLNSIFFVWLNVLIWMKSNLLNLKIYPLDYLFKILLHVDIKVQKS